MTGPRQAGKTTLVRGQLSAAATMLSLDEQGVLDAALNDPAGFAALGGRPLVIDEVQRGGEPLVRAIKAQVDRDSSPGQFVLTGSSNFLTIPTISESLAGRAGFVEVWPFTQGELVGVTDRFVDVVFTGVAGLAESAERDCAPRAARAGLRRWVSGGCTSSRWGSGRAGFGTTCERRSSAMSLRCQASARWRRWGSFCACWRHAPAASWS